MAIDENKNAGDQVGSGEYNIIAETVNDITDNGLPQKLFFVGTDHEGIVPITLTTAQRDAIVSPSTGAVIWNSTTTQLEFYNGSSWGAIDTDTGILHVVEDTTPQLGGDLDYNSYGIKLSGQTVGGSNDDAVYLSGSNTWSQADASAESTCKGALGIRISATEVLTQGIHTRTGLTAGALYFVSETAGEITTTAPTTSLSIVRPIGYALTTTELYVFPDGTFVENA